MVLVMEFRRKKVTTTRNTGMYLFNLTAPVILPRRKSKNITIPCNAYLFYRPKTPNHQIYTTIKIVRKNIRVILFFYHDKPLFSMAS